MTPRTEAGKRLDRWIEKAIVTTDESRAAYRADVHKAEAEAVNAVLDRLRVAVKKLDYRMVEWWHADSPTYSLHQVVTWSEVLALIEQERPR